MTTSPPQSSVHSSLPDPRDQNKSGVDRLFEAVLCLLVERGAELIASSLQPGEVADRAGKARASYYRTEGFPNETTAVGDVDRMDVLVATFDRLLNAEDLYSGEVVVGVSNYLKGISAHSSFRDVVTTIAHQNFGANNPVFVAYILAASLSSSSQEINSVLARYFENLTDIYHFSLSAVMDHFRLRPLPPFTSREVMMLMTALHDGLALRGLVDGAANADLYARAMATLLGGLLGPADALDRTATILDPVTDDYVNTTKTRAEILAEAHAYIDRIAPALPDMDSIGRAVGCSTESLLHLFGGLDGLLVEAWTNLLPPVYEAHQRNQATSGGDDFAALRSHLTRLAAVAHENHSLISSLVRVSAAMRTDRGRFIHRGRGTKVSDPIVEKFLSQLVEDGSLTIPRFAGRDGASAVQLFCQHVMETLFAVVLDQWTDEVETKVQASAAVTYVWELLIDR